VSEDRFGALTIDGFLEVLASDAPTPGGGAVAAIEGATGAALIAMVGRLTVDKDGYEGARDRMHAAIETATTATTELVELADRDAHAFDAVMDAFKMPKETDEQRSARSAAIQAGYVGAATIPQDVARRCVDLMALAVEVTDAGNPQAASDGLSAAATLHAGALCAIANVEINATSIKDEAVRESMLDELASLRERASAELEACRAAFERRLSARP
jgi:methenyltetrahydrofolate cyclohydrolase